MSLKSDLQSHGAVTVLNAAAERRVWRATLSAQELTDCGFADGAEFPWDTLRGILKLKAVPAQFLEAGMNFRATEEATGLVLEFE